MNAVAKNIRIFWQGALLSYRALFRWFRPVAYMASKVLSPLAQMLFFTFMGTYGGLAPASFFVIGNAMQIAAVSGIYGVTMSIGGDRWSGTLVYLFGSPAPRLTMFFGRASIHIVDGLIGVFIGFLWGYLLFGVSFGFSQLILLMLAVLITVFSTSGMGLLMGCIGLISRNVMFVNNTVYFLLLLFSGANVPENIMPGWMKTVSGFLPLTHGIKAARLIIGNSDDVMVFTGQVRELLVKELFIGCGYLVLGYILFSTFEKVAKRKGSLETV